mmetsp:Transcript_22157/g.69167  ORF Transcript_22157/g.69167 Transcript_22157/m.69167 type:complete len:315 (-) Transcript_22157:65-1009(-)|eukprot:CAMPEP_0204591960 /NCGR_PEP_ID=MMETSP0661-20131031/50662_1 /ASSEMBLY_ACC=CAM_ASM_000606 /TAXON_ID=109239 /ORGANISM="Alexandrium margalefi, Strain AMGDE01CS-322" /LENGTH=314 /DNA_ID=CAMNT_0051602131 /DNA_START=61 /DNA_END=1005 /DNA_ORIENTATION=+
MPARHVTDRPKLHWKRLIWKVEQDLETSAHHTCSAYLAGTLNIIISIAFLVGSVLFLEAMPTWAVKLGDWLFIFGACLSCLLAGQAVMEARVAFELGHLTDEGRNEFFESVWFFVSNVVFFAGSILFYPGLFVTEASKDTGHEIGACLFALGSFGMVLASYCNALGMSAQGPRAKGGTAAAAIRQLASTELFLAMVGSVLFVVGSFFYRPSLDTKCGEGTPAASLLRARARAPPHPGAAAQGDVLLQAGVRMRLDVLSPDASGGRARYLCADTAEEGTWMFIVGSALFLAQSVLHLWRARLMHQAAEQKPLKGS